VSIEAGTGHSVLGNSIYANGGLGIDIGNDGVTANDSGDADLGTNLGMNVPVPYSVLLSGGNVTVSGEARPGALVQVFLANPDPSGHGEGQTLLYSATVSPGTPGTVDPTAQQFLFTFSAGGLIAGDVLTATATDAGGNTSEFSANAFVNTALPGITVTPTSGLVTTEDGGTATFTVVLDSQPSALVTIALASDNSAEGTVPTTPLVFDSTNWSTAQTVTVTGVADFVTDGSIAYNIVLSAATSADAGYNGIDPADVSVTNQDGVNDAPVITSYGGAASVALSQAENGAAVGTVTAGDIDLPPQTLTYSISGGADAALFTVSASTGVLTFVTAPNFEAPADAGANNVYDVTVQVSDGNGGTDTQAFSITVTNINDAPTAGADAYSLAEDTTLTVSVGSGVLANDGDEDGNPITPALVSGPSNGTLTLNADGSFLYVPKANFFGTDSFVYRVSDGALSSANATVTLTVTGVQDAPTSADGSVNTDEGVTYAFTLADFNYNDVDGDPLDHIEITSLPAVGTLLLNGNPVAVNDVITRAEIAAGSLTYAPPTSVSGPLAEQFGFRVHDGTQYQAGGQFMTVGVAPLPAAPPPPPPPSGGGGSTPPPSTGGSSGSGSGSSGGSGTGGGGDGGEPAPAAGGHGSSGGESAAAAPATEAPAQEPAKVQSTEGTATITPPSVSDSSMTVRAGGVSVSSNGIGLGTPAVSEATKHEKAAEEAAVAAITAPEFKQDLDKLRQESKENATGETKVAGTVFAASTSLSVGYVIWLLRGGVLLSSLLSSLPAWRLVDPLPVLARLSDGSDDEDDDSLEDLVERNDEDDDDYDGDDAHDVDEADSNEPAARAATRRK
jgi:Bacterial Ig domain